MLDNFRLALFHASSWLARLLLLAMATIFPWCYGGAQWQSQIWLVKAGLVLAALTWLSTVLSPRRTAGCVRLSYAMLAFMVLVLIQVAPQPSLIASNFSGAARYVQGIHKAAQADPPEAEPARPVEDPPAASLWSDATRYRSVSVAPLQTRASLAVLAVAVVALWSAATLLVSTRWAFVMAVVLATGGLLNAFLGLLQLVSHSDQNLLDMPNSESFFATFVSRNSAPAYYATCIGATLAVLGTAFRSQKRKRRKEYRVTYPGTSLSGRLRNRLEDVFIDLNSTAVTCMCVLVFMLVAVLATTSRGGIIACGGACLVTLALTLGGRGDFAKATTVAAVGIAGVVAMLSFLELSNPVLSRLDELNTQLASGEDVRLVVWRYSLFALPSYWLLGCGLGTFRFAILPFHTGSPNVWFHHAENLPLEILLETGLPGFALGGLAAWMVAKQLYLQTSLQKEELLLAGALFATCAIGLQSLVDFSLILPGVFLPYCTLLGAFLGRCRRVEQDQARLEQLGVDGFDARKVAHLGVRIPSKGKLLGHSLIAGVSLICMALGSNSLSGYATAGRLASLLKQSQVGDGESFEAQFQALDENKKAIHASLQEALENHPHHPEVGLIVAQLERLLWRLNATNAIDWGAEYPLRAKWDFANPTTLSMFVRTGEPDIDRLRTTILNDQYGMQLAAASYARWQRALVACPMDFRAAWGIYSGNLQWLTAQDTGLLLENLKRLTGNNGSVTIEIGILAMRDGWVHHGFDLIQRVVVRNPERLTRNTLKAIVADISFSQLLKLLPGDQPAQLALTARTLNELALSKVDPLPAAGPLAEQLVELVYQKLTEPLHGQIGIDGYEALTWVAAQKQDPKLEVRFLEQLRTLAPDDFGRRWRYAVKLAELGEKQKAIDELVRFQKQESPTAAEIEKCDNQINEWLSSVDPAT